MSQLDDATKQALRLAAIGALLHNLGKINAKFLDKQINDAGNDYLYQHILGLIAPHIGKLPADWQNDYDVNRLQASNVLADATVAALKTEFSLPAPLDDRTDYTIGDLIEYLGQGAPWYRKDNGKYGIQHIYPSGSRLTHLMNRAHRGASGGEKEDIATAQQPVAADLYLSTPFGYETAAPNVRNINNLLQQIEAAIQKQLTASANPLLLADVIADLRPLLSQAIADTQRPLNDVTVGDIGHTGMAFLLTQAVAWILNRRVIDHAELAKTETDNTLFWRVFTVHADSLRYLEEASSLADLRSRQQQLQNTFQAISQHLEETLLAVEIYADEQRRLFIVPCLDQYTSVYQSIENLVAAFTVDGLRLTSRLSAPVTNHPLDKGGDYIGDVVLQQLQETPPYNFDAKSIDGFWAKHTNGKPTPICTACNLRPQGYGAEQVKAFKHNSTYYRKKAEERNICCICMDRRAGVAKKWAEEDLNTTVWLDEVADANGRLAVVVGTWNLARFIKSINYPQKREHITERQEPDFYRRLEQSTPWIRLASLLNAPLPAQIDIGRSPRITYTQNALGWFVGEKGRDCPNKFQNPTFPQLNLAVDDIYLEDGEYVIRLAGPHGRSGNTQLIGANFEVVGGQALKTVDNAGRKRVADLFLHNGQFIVNTCTQVHPTTPNYSFARLRRIWQTTRKFWESALAEPNRDGKPIIPQVPYRLQIIPENREHLDLGHYHAYDLKLTNSIKLSVVWDPTRKLFITTDSLDYLSKPELLGKPVIECLNGELTLEEPTGYGGKNKTWGKIVVEQATEMENSGYVPAIPILAEPRTFMALVPADKALGIVDAIRTKYEREMGKVRNRLPLHLGIVYFQRRTPLRAALDAGRRMLKVEDGSVKDEAWRVKVNPQIGPLPDGKKHLAQVENGQFSETVTVELERNGRSLTWCVPAVMGDGTTPDNWYPYVFIKNDVSGRQRVFKGLRPTGDGKTEECWLVHAGELKKDDQIYFTPATLDFQWLDSAGQRFAIAYDGQGKRRDSLTRPWLLDDLETIQRVWDLISGENGLSSSQIYALRDLIEAKRESWQPDATFTQLCSDAVRNAQWKKRGAIDLPMIAAAAVSGLLTDVIQLYMGIMKCKPHREEDEND